MIIASILCLTILSNFAFAYKKQGPPRANDLSDHFGSNPSANQYGPVPPVVGGSHDLMRQGMLSGIPITPIKNFSQEVQPKEVVAGNFLNTAPDASLIIKPKLAGIIYFNIIQNQRQRLMQFTDMKQLLKLPYI